MKDFYKISEISKLYNIGTDSIRYYERLGILKPRRDANGYRLYGLKEMYKLNLIRDLRKLDFSMEQIKEYLDKQCVSNTIAMLRHEEKYLCEQVKELKVRVGLIEERIQDLSHSLQVDVGEFALREVKRRHCVSLDEHITRDEEMDFLIKKLEQQHEDKIKDFGNQMIGAYFAMEDLKKGLGNVYESIFFVLDEKEKAYEFDLPKSNYLSYFYEGSYKQNLKRVGEMFDYCAQKGLAHDGKPFELYHIDNRDTILESEFLTEIQLRILT